MGNVTVLALFCRFIYLERFHENSAKSRLTSKQNLQRIIKKSFCLKLCLRTSAANTGVGNTHFGVILMKITLFVRIFWEYHDYESRSLCVAYWRSVRCVLLTTCQATSSSNALNGDGPVDKPVNGCSTAAVPNWQSKTFYSRYRKLMYRRWKSRLSKNTHAHKTRIYRLISSDVLEKSPCESAFCFILVKSKDIWSGFSWIRHEPIDSDFFSELRPLLLIFLLSWNYKQIKELLRNSLLNQDQSNHFIANAEHFEIFGRTEKRNSGEDECYQFDNISEKVILTWKSLQIVIHLISPLKHREDVTKKNLQHVISGFNLNENTASLLSRNSIRVQCRVVSFFLLFMKAPR